MPTITETRFLKKHVTVLVNTSESLGTQFVRINQYQHLRGIKNTFDFLTILEVILIFWSLRLVQGKMAGEMPESSRLELSEKIATKETKVFLV